MKRIVIALSLSVVLSAAAIPPQTISEGDLETTLERLTLEQKARLLVGAPGCDDAPSHYTPGAAGWTYPVKALGIPSINLADGPVGVRINPWPWQDVAVTYDSLGLPTTGRPLAESDAPGGKPAYCTAFPSTTALAATWNRDMARLQGELMGEEARCYGVDVLLTPGINIMRDPLCGRNFEYYSEDPYLTGVLASEIIKGIQDKGIGTSLKHFVANNQQTGKKYNDARMSRRALREIYLKAFEMCVRDARPWTVMGSYNKIAGEFTQTNRDLMRTLLRDEWGFDGLVLTDWTVRRPTADLLNARTALMMPGEEEIVREIIEAVESGAVSRETLDDCVRDVLRVVARSITGKGWHKTEPDLKAHAAASRTIAGESMVLLKNDKNILPLKRGSKIALFGASAYKSIAGGTGSSNVNKEYIVDISDGLVQAGYNISPLAAAYYEKYNKAQELLLDPQPDCPEWQRVSYHRVVVPEPDLSGATVFINREAEACEAAVVVLARKSGETSDRRVDDDFNLTAAEKTMIERVCEAFHREGKPVVVVMNVCGTVETASWSALPDAIVMAWFPGQECGHAVADVLSGDVNPSGRLPMTFPMAYADMPSSRNYPYVGQESGRNFDYTDYEEDIYVGYRYFDKSRREVAYPFGYGLSYTTFAYSDARARRRGGATEISVTVTNSGAVPGKEVVQLYVSAPESTLPKPVSELRAFAKTRLLAPGESQRLTLSVRDGELASFDEQLSAWVCDKGDYVATFSHGGDSAMPVVTFKVPKRTERKVNDILAPVAPVKTITAKPDAFNDMKWVNGSVFPVLGRVYRDSLPLYSRIPAFRKEATREALYELGQHTSGMALRFRSDTRKMALRWESLTRNDMTHMASMAIRGADLYVKTDAGRWRFIGVARPMGDPTEWLIIDNMEPQMREYMLHLPLYDGLKSLEIGVSPDARVLAPAIESPEMEKPVVIYGSSIAHGATASRPGMAASNIIRRELDRETINLGFSANAHIDYEIAEMMADVDASVYVLDFVPNALVPEIEGKTEKFVRILRDRRPGVPLVFIEDPMFSHALLDTVTADVINAKNRAIKSMYDKLKSQGMENIYYIKSEELLPADGDGSSDGIHFTDIGFRTYADTLLKTLKNILK